MAVQDVRQEIKILATCNHANIVRYGGSFFKDEKLWVGVSCSLRPTSFVADPMVILVDAAQICMEYCGGGSVSDLCLILDSGLEEEHIAIICREALKVYTL